MQTLSLHALLARGGVGPPASADRSSACWLPVYGVTRLCAAGMAPSTEWRPPHQGRNGVINTSKPALAPADARQLTQGWETAWADARVALPAMFLLSLVVWLSAPPPRPFYY